MPSWDKPPEDPYKDNSARNQRWQGIDTGETSWCASCCIYELLWSMFGALGCFGWLLVLALTAWLA